MVSPQRHGAVPQLVLDALFVRVWFWSMVEEIHSMTQRWNDDLFSVHVNIPSAVVVGKYVFLGAAYHGVFPHLPGVGLQILSELWPLPHLTSDARENVSIYARKYVR